MAEWSKTLAQGTIPFVVRVSSLVTVSGNRPHDTPTKEGPTSHPHD